MKTVYLMLAASKHSQRNYTMRCDAVYPLELVTGVLMTGRVSYPLWPLSLYSWLPLYFVLDYL